MPLNIQHTPQDEAPLLDGDDRFLKVVMRGHPALLAPGIVPFAINYRFREGVPDPRGGSVKPAWLNQISGTNISAWDSVQGRGHYVDPLKRQWTLLAVNGGVRAILPHNVPLSVPLPAGVTLTGGEQFLQTGSTVLLLRGTGGDTLQMTDLIAGFTAVPAPLVAGMSAIPAAIRGVVAGNRTWLVTTSNQVWASDLLDHTTYHPLNQFKADGGDEIVQLALFGQTSLIVLFKKSVNRLTDILNPDVQGLLTNTQFPRITGRYGCLSADSVVDLGNDLAWYCQEGVARLSLTIQGEIQVANGGEWPPMFSDDIHPLIARVRGDYASRITADLADGRLYFAVPLDDAEVQGPERLALMDTDGAGIFTGSGLQVGRRYRLTVHPADGFVSLLCGSDVLTATGEFVAESTVFIITMGAELFVSSSLIEVFVGVNNAVLVYDFKALEPGWQGYDEGEGILFPKYFFRRDYNGRERLFFLNGDGWGTLYEEGCEDAIGQPYVDVYVNTLPAVGNTIQVNGGTLVTATSATTNSGANWGCFNLASARQGLWNGAGGPSGYAPNNVAPWTTPSARGMRRDPTGTVRFISTSGRRPVVTTTGSWATISIYQWQPIVTQMLSRGYATPAKLERKTARKLQVLVETWDPSYSIALKSEGVNEEVEFVSDKTRSRTRYHRPFNSQAWLPSNVNNDFDTKGREDYSLTLTTPFKLGDGLGVLLQQEAEHSVNVKGRARAHQVRMTNSNGRLRLLGIGYEGRRRERGHGVKI